MKIFALGMLVMMCAVGSAHAWQISVSNPNSQQRHSLVAEAASSAVLWDQYDNDQGQGASSQDFETANDTFDSQAADDFVIPSEVSWSIESISAAGVYFNGSGPAVTFNVYFYADAGGLPGSLLASRVGQTYTNMGSPIIALSSPVVLETGTYWVSVQARMDYSAGGQWAWETRTVSTGNPAALQNPGGGFACSGGNGWVLLTTCVTDTGPDLMFRLNGTVVANDEIFCAGFESGEDGSCNLISGP